MFSLTKQVCRRQICSCKFNSVTKFHRQISVSKGGKKASMYQPATVYLAWAPASGGNIPRNAVVGGRDNTSREDLYIGRVILGNESVPGKVVRSHKVLYIPYGGKEIPHSNYEVLVSDIPDKLKWLPDANGRNPEHAVQGGHAQDGEPMYIARAQAPDGGLCVGKLHRSHGCCYIPWGGKEHAVKSYEVLTFPRSAQYKP